MKTLHMPVGLPRSGKSTWALTTGWPIVNPDSIRLAIHGQPFVASAEKLVWTITHYMVEALFLAGHENVILDACNINNRRRNEWQSKSWQREYKLFGATKEECIARTGKYNEYLIPIIERMAKDWEWPKDRTPDRIKD